MKNLNQLFEEAKKNGIEAGFDKLADYLMNECVLEANNNEYRIAEIEFYYFNEKDEHADIFVHCNECQKKSNVFYFHPAGVDITFGNDSYYGGILIRGIINIKTGKYIIGPNKVAYDELLKCNNKNKLMIELKTKKQETYHPCFFKSCRVNLNIKSQHKNEAKNFIFKSYRYILNDEELILNLLNFSESHFLAVMLQGKEFSPEIKGLLEIPCQSR